MPYFFGGCGLSGGRPGAAEPGGALRSRGGETGGKFTASHAAALPEQAREMTPAENPAYSLSAAESPDLKTFFSARGVFSSSSSTREGDDADAGRQGSRG